MRTKNLPIQKTAENKTEVTDSQRNKRDPTPLGLAQAKKHPATVNPSTPSESPEVCMLGQKIRVTSP